MPTIAINGVDYHYRRRGSGHPFIVLHGFTGSTESWQDQMDSFAPLADTIVVDLLGHGRTESPSASARYAMEAAADDIVALATKLGIKQFHLLGYSMGGRLALALALRYPDRVTSLTLESASPGIVDEQRREERRRADESLASLIETDGVEAFVSRWERLPLFSSQMTQAESRKDRLRRQRLANNSTGLANSLRGMGTGSQPSLWRLLPSVNTPTLLICGALDQKFVQIGKQMAAQMPDARLRIMPDAGHSIHFEQPLAFALTVSEFINDQNCRKA